MDQSLEKIKALEEFGDFREKAFTACNEAIATLPAPWIFYWTANVSFTKSCFLDGEPFFDEDFNGNWGWEDVEFGYRLHKKGARFVLNPRAEAIHYPHDKYKDFEEASMVNLEKFRQLHPSPEVGILYDISTRDIDNVFLNDHLRKDLSKIIS